MSNVFKIQTKTDEPKKISVRQVVVETKEAVSQPEKENPNVMIEKAKQTLQQAKMDANNLKEETEKQIAKQKEQFEQQKQLVMEQIKNEAFEMGFKEGKSEAIQSYENDLEEAKSIVQAAQKEQKKWIEQQEDIILTIALKAAEKILFHTVQEDENAFRSLVKGAIEEVNGFRSLELYVHPKAYEEMLELKQELEQTIGNQASLSVFPSKDLDRYSCIIETPYGQIDASLDTQLTELKTKLIDLLALSKV